MLILLEAFQNLEGTTVGEKKRSFYLYLKTLKDTLEPNQIKELTSLINPSTYLEKIFKMEMLIHFHQFSEVLDIIRAGNETYIYKVYQHKWFFDELKKQMNPESVVSDLLAKISLAARVKFINKLISHTTDGSEYGNELFDSYCDRYGVHSAKILLPVCTSEKVRNVLSGVNIKLNEATGKRLLDKDVHLLSLLFKKSIKYSLIKHAVSNNIDFVWELSKTESFMHYNFGRRQTRRVVAIDRDSVLRDANKFVHVLKHRQVAKDLGEDFEKFFCDVFDKNFVKGKHFESIIFECMSSLPKHKQVKLISDTVLRVFGIDLLEMEERFLKKILPLADVNDREKLAEHLCKHSDDYLPYLDIQKSIPQIKEKIALSSSIQTRRQLVEFLVETCKINKNEEALLEVLKYFLQRHRNDNASVQQAFVNKLLELFKLEELSQEHWKYIDELSALHEIKEGNRSWTMGVFQKRILYCLSNNLPADQLIQDYIKTYGLRPSALVELKKLGRPCLIEAANQLKSADLKDYAFGGIKIFFLTNEWNKENPSKEIDTTELLPLVVASVEHIVSNGVVVNTNVFNYFIRENFWAPILELFWKQKPHRVEPSILYYLLKTKPMNFLSNAESASLDLFAQILNYPKILGLCRKYSHLGIPQKLTTAISDKSENCASGDKPTAIQVLSFLMEAKDFCDLVSQYYPDDRKIDVQSEESKNLYPSRAAAIKSLKNVRDPSLGLSTLLNFTKGDYLPLALPILQILFSKCSEEDLNPVITKLLKEPVSVRKHALYLSLPVMSKKYVSDLVLNAANTEKNFSMQVHLFRVTRSYLIKNPSDEIFEALKNVAAKLDINDKEAFDKFVNVENLSDEYLPRYIEFGWRLLEDNKEKGSKLQISRLQLTLLCLISDDKVNLLSSEFCKKIIIENFMTEVIEVTKFTAIYLLYHSSPAVYQERLAFVIDTIKTKSQHMHEKSFLKSLGQFTKIFYNMSIKCELTPDILTMFLQQWSTVVKSEKLFEQYVMLRIAILHFEALKEDKDNYLQLFSRKISALLDEFDQRFGAAATQYCSSSMYNFIMLYVIHTHENNYPEERVFQFLNNVYDCSVSVSSALFVINSLTAPEGNTQESRLLKDELIAKLKNRNEACIQILVYSRLLDD